MYYYRSLILTISAFSQASAFAWSDPGLTVCCLLGSTTGGTGLGIGGSSGLVAGVPGLMAWWSGFDVALSGFGAARSGWLESVSGFRELPGSVRLELPTLSVKIAGLLNDDPCLVAFSSLALGTGTLMSALSGTFFEPSPVNFFWLSRQKEEFLMLCYMDIRILYLMPWIFTWKLCGYDARFPCWKCWTFLSVLVLDRRGFCNRCNDICSSCNSNYLLCYIVWIMIPTSHFARKLVLKPIMGSLLCKIGS